LSLDGTSFSAIDGTITTALHTPKTLVFRRGSGSVRDVVFLYLFDLQKLSLETNSPRTNYCDEFSERRIGFSTTHHGDIQIPPDLVVAQWGLDHGVGHPLLLLGHAKAPNY
jgi:hypothetical protein